MLKVGSTPRGSSAQERGSLSGSETKAHTRSVLQSSVNLVAGFPSCSKLSDTSSGGWFSTATASTTALGVPRHWLMMTTSLKARAATLPTVFAAA